ncbi:DUF423 domain-containing protein [Coraliomargarita parva]|uniref:DUF423 domain-containing protein n=1 Tax=Coraliomargarita parva TaxID=3014050 RepID=UPI0022B48999|nr:DUF423 domain-containing protein [Coraliomargarita parva]
MTEAEDRAIPNPKSVSKNTVWGASFAGLAVVLGAMGAHALKPDLLERNSLTTWQTAVDYQMWHALALILSGLSSSACVRRAGRCFIPGIILFSGSLYWLSFDGPRWLGPITPLGGLCLIAGWIFLAIGYWRSK